MNFLAIFLTSSLAIATIITAILLTHTFRINFITGELIRFELAGKIGHLRFGKMSKRHRLDINELVHFLPLIEINSQIKNCQSCEEISNCDSVLEKQDVRDKKLDLSESKLDHLQNKMILKKVI